MQGNLFFEMSEFMADVNRQINELVGKHQAEVKQLQARIAELEKQVASVREPDKTAVPLKPIHAVEKENK